MSLTSQDLEARIKLILSQTEWGPKIYALRNPSFDFDHCDLRYGYVKHTLPIAAPGDAQNTNEQVFLLRTLYAQCGSGLQKQFPVVLMNQLTENTATVIVHAAIDTGHLSALGKALREKRLNPATRVIVWHSLREKLATESHRFTTDDLAEVDAMRAAEMKRIPKFKDRDREPPVMF